VRQGHCTALNCTTCTCGCGVSQVEGLPWPRWGRRLRLTAWTRGRVLGSAEETFPLWFNRIAPQPMPRGVVPISTVSPMYGYGFGSSPPGMNPIDLPADVVVDRGRHGGKSARRARHLMPCRPPRRSGSRNVGATHQALGPDSGRTRSCRPALRRTGRRLVRPPVRLTITNLWTNPFMADWGCPGCRGTGSSFRGVRERRVREWSRSWRC
jgi:hypothetical protein